MRTVAVMGAGAWGTALALLLARANADVTLYSRNVESVAMLYTKRENSRCLPGVMLPDTLHVTASLAEVGGKDALVLVVPSQCLRDSLVQLQTMRLPPAVPLLLCSKGIETQTLKLMSEVAADILPENPVAVLSGPNFADEVAQGLPAATTIACDDKEIGNQWLQLFGHSAFRPYYSPDIMGAQIGGAVKNVLAIGCGILTGRGLGENARAALLTRGLAEMVRLGLAKGACAETLMGLSGIGDLILTCSSVKSRNMSLGMRLAQGEPLEQILALRQNVTEGVASAASVTALAAQLGVEMPICEAVYSIMYDHIPVDTAIQNLLQRPLTSEL